MITSQEMKKLEELALSKDLPVANLMENAGKAVVREVLKRYDLQGKRVVVFCGTGNNGGDGLVAARQFYEKGYPVVVLLFGHKDNLSDESREKYDALWRKVNVVSISSLDELNQIKLQKHLSYLLVDALLGIGIKGPAREPVASAIDLFNSISGIKVAVDVPSGIHPDTGEVLEKACEADLVVALHDVKQGSEKFMEKTVIVDIGLPRK